MSKMHKIHSSRRAVGLKPEDFDHEIDIIDNEIPISRYTTNNSSTSVTQITRVSTTAQLLPHSEEDEEDGENMGQGSALGTEHNGSRQVEERAPQKIRHQHDLPHPAMSPTIEVQEPTSEAFHGDHPQVKAPRPRVERETAIDILYENERGGFLCGIPLFSAAALGSLDAQPWTNAYHKPSPTSIRTATVPDPSWEWIWPEWRVNHQEGMDEDGWEYSFAFSKKMKFSWHGPSWWNSYVRRRAWIRKRAQLPEHDQFTDPHMLNSEYFTVRPASERTKRSRESLNSRMGSKTSMTQQSSLEVPQEITSIDDVDVLMQQLRRARVDREKLEAVDNYLDHAIDLSQLARHMHDIMGIFVFQASRRILLGRLMQVYDKTKEELEDGKAKEDPDLKDRGEALEAAIVHADEEVRKLSFWSDVKQMAERGESRGAVDDEKGWYDAWDGLDKSGPPPPNGGKLPG